MLDASLNQSSAGKTAPPSDCRISRVSREHYPLLLSLLAAPFRNWERPCAKGSSARDSAGHTTCESLILLAVPCQPC